MNAKTALGVTAAGLALLATLTVRDLKPAGARSVPPFGVRGATHVHTGFSRDGRGTVEDVARAARARHLQFVVVTDHNTQAALPEAGYRDGVLVIGGMEKSTDAGHALVLGTGPIPFGLDGDPREVARDAQGLGGFVVAAHPASTDPERGWSGGWDGIDGIEVLNFGQPESWPRPGLRAVPLLAGYGLDPTWSLLRGFAFSRDALRSWDQELAARPLAGLLGTDAHGGLRAGSHFLPFPTHRHIFGLASQHLRLDRPLTGEAAADTAAVLDALRRGRGYVAVDAMGDASRFSFAAESGGARAGPGDDLPLAGEARLTADAGGVPGARLVLLRDGSRIAEGERLDFTTGEAGVYRVEAYLAGAPAGAGPDPLPWVISNPVSLFPSDVLAARAARRARPPVSPAASWPGPLGILDDFARPAGPEWQIDRSLDAAGAWRIEDEALRFDFALGPRAPTHADLVRWKPLDLSRASAVVFRVRAERTMRFDLQVRTESPGQDPPLRTWRRSVRAEPEWTEVVVPLSALKTYDHRPGGPDLHHVVGLYLHLDEAILAPGARGTLWIDDLAIGPPLSVEDAH